MAKSRKDNKGRVLRKGETQRSCDGKYVYTYVDPEGKRRSIYSKDIMELREREVKLMKDQLDGLDAYAAGTSTINFVFDRYISTKAELRETTMRNYKYMYDRFIRGGFGKKKIAAVKYSDVLQFYQHLLKEKEMQINTLETIHTVLHPTFQLAVRDNIIRVNPSDGVMAQIKKQPGKNHGVRHELFSQEEANADFANILADMKCEDRKFYFFHIELKETHEQVGSVGYTVVDNTPRGKIVHAGYFIYPKFWSEGYVTEAFKKVLEYAFTENDVYRVTTGCLAENIGSEKVMIKCGLIKEAEHLDWEWHDGKMKTRLEYRLLKNEWQGQQ